MTRASVRKSPGCGLSGWAEEGVTFQDAISWGGHLVCRLWHRLIHLLREPRAEPGAAGWTQRPPPYLREQGRDLGCHYLLPRARDFLPASPSSGDPARQALGCDPGERFSEAGRSLVRAHSSRVRLSGGESRLRQVLTPECLGVLTRTVGKLLGPVSWGACKNKMGGMLEPSP